MKRDNTQAETRRANRGNVPGVLGMAELAMLTEVRPHAYSPFSKLYALCAICNKPPNSQVHTDFEEAQR